MGPAGPRCGSCSGSKWTHKLDGRFCVSLLLAGGGFTEKIVHRLWVIVILEVVSRAVVGYYFSTGREVSKDDVLRAIKTGLSRPKLRPVTFSATPYLPDAGLLGSLGEEFVGCVGMKPASTAHWRKPASTFALRSNRPWVRPCWSRAIRSRHDEAKTIARSLSRFSATSPDVAFSA